MAYRRKIQRGSPFDSGFYNYNGFKRLKRSSMSDLSRIERARWRALLVVKNRLLPLWNAAFERVQQLGEAFISSDDDGGRPQRIYASGDGISSDSGFWNPENKTPKAEGNHALDQLAVIAAELEWEEQEARLLEEKLLRVTEEKLAAGAEYEKARRLLNGGWRRVGTLNRLLVSAIGETKVIPIEDRVHDRYRIFYLRINNRLYAFSGGYCPEGKEEMWPNPLTDNIIEVAPFRLDEKVVGLSREVVRTRFGEPNLMFSSRKKDFFANIWVYGSVGVRFKQQVVEKFLDAKAVSRLIRTAK